MGWLGRLMGQETRCSCCFCGESDDIDTLEVHRYCRYYSYTKRYYHGSCLRQVLNNPWQYSANNVDTALAIAEQRKRHEEALRAEQEIRRKRLTKLERLNCPKPARANSSWRARRLRCLPSSLRTT